MNMKTVIADDEKMALVVLKKQIDWEGLGLTLEGEARDGNSLLELIREKKPQLVITDIRMPRYSGLEIIAKTLEMGQKPRFVITSAYADFTYARQAMRLGVEDFLPKPVEKKELNQVLGEIVRRASQDQGEQKLPSGLVCNACGYIREHYGEKITLESISEHFFISPNYFSALFKKETGMNFVEYLTDVRMKEARELLKDPACSVADVAGRIGYRDTGHFVANFSKKYGVTPAVWRRGEVQFSYGKSEKSEL